MLELRSAITISRRKMRQPRSNYLGVLREEKKPCCCSHFRPPRAMLAIDAPAIYAVAIRSDRGRGDEVVVVERIIFYVGTRLPCL